MFGIFLVFLLTALCLALLFWLGSLFLQGMFYTQPSENLHWQAPTAGAVLGAFIALWCLMIALSSQASPTDIPYDALHRFSPQVEMFPTPVREMWAVKKKGDPVLYKMERIPDRLTSNRFEYKSAGKTWDRNTEEILLEYQGEKLRFVRVRGEQGANPLFVCDKGGWVMREYDGEPSGFPIAFRWGRFLANLFLNFFHLALWLVCIWLILRFSMAHALVLSVVLWLTTTLILLPMVFSYAGEVAVKRRTTGTTPTAPVGKKAAILPPDRGSVCV